jgi:hypothetical protein
MARQFRRRWTDRLDWASSGQRLRLVFREIRCEAPGQLARGLVIRLLVGPGAARVEDLARNLWTAFRHEDPEIGVLAHRRRGRRARRAAMRGDDLVPGAAVIAKRASPPPRCEGLAGGRAIKADGLLRGVARRRDKGGVRRDVDAGTPGRGRRADV